MFLRLVSLLLVYCGLTGCASNRKTEKLLSENSKGELLQWDLTTKGKRISVYTFEGDQVMGGARSYSGVQNDRRLTVSELSHSRHSLAAVTNAVWTCEWEDASKLKAQRKSMRDAGEEDFVFYKVVKNKRLKTILEWALGSKKGFPWVGINHRYEIETGYPMVLPTGEADKAASDAFSQFLKQHFVHLHQKHIGHLKGQIVERQRLDRAGVNPHQTWADEYEVMEWRQMRFMSLLVNSFHHVSGAGGFAHWQGLNLWFRNGVVQEVKLRDLFKPDSPYVAVIDRYSRRGVKEGMVPLKLEDAKLEEADLQAFSIQRQGVMFVLGEFGDFRLLVPWAELEECIEPNGIVNEVRFGRK